jgi:hypothetical protein
VDFVIEGAPLVLGQGRGREAGQTASFSSLAGRKAIFLLALILICSPVAGLRPTRAGRERTWKLPRPFSRILLPFFRCLVKVWTNSPRMASPAASAAHGSPQGPLLSASG